MQINIKNLTVRNIECIIRFVIKTILHILLLKQYYTFVSVLYFADLFGCVESRMLNFRILIIWHAYN